MSVMSSARPTTVHDPGQLATELRRIPTFADLPEEGLSWMTGVMWVEHLKAGDLFIQEGSDADRLFVVLDGELRSRQESSAEGPTFISEPGEVTGMLPFSRMKQFPVTVRAVRASRVACLSARDFPELLQRLPALGPRLVGIMSDRIRDVAREDLQHDKLMALGKLSAGLAHELNNPAAAIGRTVDSLREAITGWQQATVRLERQALTARQRDALAGCERECIADLDSLPVLDSLASSDREQELVDRLEGQGVSDAWKLAPGLVEAGFTDDDLACVAGAYPPEVLGDVLTRVTMTLTIERLLRDVQGAASRISDLVQSVKEYSHMDRGTEQEVDVNRSLESTLTMLQHRLRDGVTVVREYDSELPRVAAHGSELSQVWTNLIDNALDAMQGRGTLRVRTARDFDRILVEVEDSGPGIPPEIQDRIFEPFFTTKRVGEGTGLGLDTVYRIVRKHRGEVRCESRPGRTCFQVRLPLSRREA